MLAIPVLQRLRQEYCLKFEANQGSVSEKTITVHYSAFHAPEFGAPCVGVWEILWRLSSNGRHQMPPSLWQQRQWLLHGRGLCTQDSVTPRESVQGVDSCAIPGNLKHAGTLGPSYVNFTHCSDL